MKGFGHEPFGGAALVMAVPSEGLVVAIISNIIGAASNSDDVSFGRDT